MGGKGERRKKRNYKMLWPYLDVITESPVHSRFARDSCGLWSGQFVPAVPIAHILLCLLQVLQYRSWCQELEKQLEATGVSEAILCSP